MKRLLSLVAATAAAALQPQYPILQIPRLPHSRELPPHLTH